MKYICQAENYTQCAKPPDGTKPRQHLFDHVEDYSYTAPPPPPAHHTVIMATETAVLCLHQEETGLKSGVRLSFDHPHTRPAAVVCDPIQHGGRQLRGTFVHFST